MRTFTPAWLVVLAAGLSPGPLCAQQRNAELRAPEMIQYRVRPGDTLYRLGQLYFRNPADHRRVMRLNRIDDPYRLPPGSLLSVPLELLKAESIARRSG